MKRPSDTPLPQSPEASRSESVPHYEYARASPQLESPVDRVVYVPVPQGKVLGAYIENASPQEFATVQQLADVQQQINALLHAPQTVFVPTFTGPAATTPVSVATFAQGQRIDNLSGTSLSNITVSGVSGLTDGDIPDWLTASNYLPLSGGTLTGDLTMSGTLTAGALSVAALSSSGALTGPYVTATSTTATSTFAHSLDVTGVLKLNSSASDTKTFTLGNGTWWQTPIPYLRPTVATTTTNVLSGIAFDLMPNGTDQDVWVDICSTDVVANSSSWECLNLKKAAHGAGSISVNRAGSGTLYSLALQPNGGNVGIGTTTPSGHLHILSSPLGVTPSAGADDLVLEGSGQVGMSIFGTTFSSIFFGSTTAPIEGVVQYRHVPSGSGDRGLEFYAGFASQAFTGPRMLITEYGNVGIGGVGADARPNTLLNVTASSTATSTGSQLQLRSLRTEISSDNLIGGVDFASNDTSLTSPGSGSSTFQVD